MKYLVCFFALFAIASSASDTTVPAGKLGREISVIGFLEVPLGKVCTIKGKMLEEKELNWKGAEGLKFIRVTRVDGKALPQPVQIQVYSTPGFSLSKLKPGEEMELKGYESGGFQGIPDDPALKECIWQDTAWHFSTQFNAFKKL